MKIRFFMLGTQKHKSSKRLERELKCVFSEHMSQDGDVQHFSALKDATGEIAKAVADTHAMVFIVDTGIFAGTKLMLSKAFGFEMQIEENIFNGALKTLGKDEDEVNDEFTVAHAYVPPKARSFVLEDNLYSGFSVANGNQTIIILPYEKDRTSVLLSTQVVPYINNAYHTDISYDSLRKYNTERLSAVLMEKDVKLALAGTNTSTFFSEYISSSDELKDRVAVSPVNEKRGNMPPVDYVVNLSITASELLSCKYGVVISNAFYTGEGPASEKTVYIAVTNERETQLREIHSFPGEKIADFLARCSGDLCAFISDVLSDDEEHREYVSVRKKAAEKRYMIAMIAVAAVIILESIFCLAYFSKHDYTLTQWADDFIEWVFPAGNPFAGMFSNDEINDVEDMMLTEAKTSEEKTEASEESTSEEESSQEEPSSEEPSDAENKVTQ